MKYMIILILCYAISACAAEELRDSGEQSSQPEKKYDYQSIRSAPIADLKKWIKHDSKGVYLISQFKILRARKFSLSELIAIFGKDPSPGVADGPGWPPEMNIFFVDDENKNSPTYSDMLFYPYASASRKASEKGSYYLSLHSSGIHESELKK